MPITLDLRENDHVLYYAISDPWTFHDLVVMYERNRAIRDQHMHKIHVIANLTATRQLPKDIISSRHLSPDANHPRAGYVLMVGPSQFIRSVIEVTSRLLHTDKIRVVASEEEAWAMIREIIRAEKPNAE
ncbi:MAG TPA: hypothetical protein VKQ72_23160 [Aggregatilineales bacterium]|nr:hypothetical protein [Aggregatilineales bacterium]